MANLYNLETACGPAEVRLVHRSCTGSRVGLKKQAAEALHSATAAQTCRLEISLRPGS